jgi:cytochrome P450/NADPH-cytochrome P450 reductase
MFPRYTHVATPECEASNSNAFVPPCRFHDQIFIKPLIKMTLFERAHRHLQSIAADNAIAQPGNAAKKSFSVSGAHAKHATPLLVLYGSNGGSTHGLAQQFYTLARSLGFKPWLCPMNDYKQLTDIAGKAKLLVALTATYNGLPPDQAVQFMAALAKAEESRTLILQDISYAVFGCGNTEWAATYQDIPKRLDLQLGALGAQRLLARGVGNSAGDLDAEFALWGEAVWPVLAASAKIDLVVSEGNGSIASSLVEVSTVSPQPFVMPYEMDMLLAEMTANRELQPKSTEQSTRHVEFTLPTGRQKYLAGDHLVVMAENDPAVVQQLMARFGFVDDTVIVSKGDEETSMTMASNLDVLRKNQPVLLRDVLTKAYDLARPLNAKCLQYVKTKATDAFESEQLSALTHQTVQRMSMPLFELLLKFKSIQLSLGELLSLLPAIKSRLYSISSSPKSNISVLSITVGVVSGKTPTGRTHNGLCSTFLSRKPVGEKVWVMIRDTKSSFRPPAPEVPMIMIGPGTGVAPMMGFLQERRSQAASGVKIGKIVLFFGCRSEDSHIYRDELNSYAADGTLTHLHVAFSRTGKKEYVQTLMKKHSQVLWGLLQACRPIAFDFVVPRMQCSISHTLLRCRTVHISMYVAMLSAWPQMCGWQSSGSFKTSRKWTR